MASALPPPPNGQVLSLVAALSNTQNHELHVQAIQARDQALSSSPESYGDLCAQLAYLMVGSDDPSTMIPRMDSAQLQQFQQSDPITAQQLHQQVRSWTPFGQMAGLILKEALLHPPIRNGKQSLYLISPASEQVKQVMLHCLGCKHAELRNVASTVISTTAVSSNSVQPSLCIHQWPDLMDILMYNLEQTDVNKLDGSLSTIQKIMEDGPHEVRTDQLDALVPILLKFFTSTHEKTMTMALQTIVNFLSAGLMPSALVAHFNDYLGALSALAMNPSVQVRMWVCRSIVTLLSMRTEYLHEHGESICRFMLQSTADIMHPDVALEACEFWLAFASLDQEVCPPDIVEQVLKILPDLVPILLRGMVYLPEQQQELKIRNEMDQTGDQSVNRPVFHKMKVRHNSGGGGGGDDDDDDDDNLDDDEGNSWTLRKSAAASLDCLATLYGPDAILPAILPALQEGLSNSDPWIQEASILALGAISEGCGDAMESHLAQLHPYLMNHLSTAEGQNTLPQVKSIAAWTIGRYAPWAIEQVQNGSQGHLLAQMTETFLIRLGDQSRRTQVSCCSAFGVVIEAAGDLMIPYLEHVLTGLNGALQRYQGRSLLIVFDVLGITADFVGQAIGEGKLPEIYVPTLLHMWDVLAQQDPTDRTLVPLLECMASIASVCKSNYQPYALGTFEKSMAMIEAVTLHLTASGEVIESEEDADPIICAADVIDGLVEGFGNNFPSLLNSSKRYGQVFNNMLLGLIRHEVAGVRMSAFAIVGDLARNAPSVLETALLDLLKDSICNLDPTHPSVCNNAVWAIGEICLQCVGNPLPLEPVAQDLVQSLISLLMGNGLSSGGIGIPGLPENSATAAGRLALVNPNFVAVDLPRFLLGWCDGMARITDLAERRDAFKGFIQAVYANPNAIQSATAKPADAISSILFAIVSWHMPDDSEAADRIASVIFQPFPEAEEELKESLKKLLFDIKESVNDETWQTVQNQLPVNVRKLLFEVYQV